MLAGSASLLKQAPVQRASSHIPLQPLDSRFAQMARVFEIASGATKVFTTGSHYKVACHLDYAYSCCVV